MFPALILLFGILSAGGRAAPQGYIGEKGGYGSENYGGVSSPPYTWLFEYPLPIPAIAQPSYEEMVNGKTIQYFELTIEAFESQIYPNLGAAQMVGYNGSAPGPTFHVQKGVESVVRLLNKGSGPATMHLHGSPSHSTWDGWASDLIQPGQYKDYYYPNVQSSSLWYHDHVDGQTAPNTYYGQQGLYLINDPEEDVLGLPSGQYDIPLAIADKAYQSNGQLASPTDSDLNFFGDIIQVNGQPWPFVNVEPRKYRLRLCDMSISRSYDLAFTDENGSPVSFQVIASDGGLFEYPVTSENVVISMGERYEIVVDFSSYKGSNVTLMNNLEAFWMPQFSNTNQVMRFVVGETVSDSSNNGAVPSSLRNVDWPPETTAVDHVFNFQHGGDDLWTINGVAFSDVNNRVLARMPQGSVEVWQLNYASGPGVHPVHVHLVNFQIISRTGGSRGVLPYEAAGLKDVVLLDPGESVQVRAVFGPWNGLYAFHCHNLIHEDSMMMDAFNVTRLQALGYDFNSTAAFSDPMNPTYAAKDYSADAYSPASIQDAINSLGSLDAYAPAVALSKSEAAHYKTAGYPSPSAAVNTAAPTGGFPSGNRPQYGAPRRRWLPAPTHV